MFASIGAAHIFGSVLIFPVVWICLHEFSLVTQYKRMKGFMYGLVLLMLILKCSHIFGTDFENLLTTSETIIELPSWVGHMAYISALVFTAWQLLSAYSVSHNTKHFKMVLLFTVILGVATFKAPGIGAGIVIIVLGFAHSNRIIIGLGVISLLVYSSSYYYLMNETLLFKSGVLFVVAALMLFSRLLLNKLLPAFKDK